MLPLRRALLHYSTALVTGKTNCGRGGRLRSCHLVIRIVATYVAAHRYFASTIDNRSKNRIRIFVFFLCVQLPARGPANVGRTVR